MKVLKSQQNVNDKGEKPAETITSAGLSDIPREDEKNYKLEEVIEITVNNNASRKTNILYLKKEPKPNLKILSLRHGLEYGCTIKNDKIVRVKNEDEKPFVIKDCKFDYVNDGYHQGKISWDSEQDWLIENNLYVNA